MWRCWNNRSVRHIVNVVSIHAGIACIFWLPLMTIEEAHDNATMKSGRMTYGYRTETIYR
jgi:hypothetical protein